MQLPTWQRIYSLFPHSRSGGRLGCSRFRCACL